MKLVTYDDHRLGVVVEESVVDVSEAVPERDGWPWAYVLRTVEEFDRLRPGIEALVSGGGPRKPLSEVQLLAPVPTPTKIVAAVANYAKHHGEVGGGSGSVPGEVFLKAPSSLVGTGGTVVLPHAPGRDIHHEAELAVVIGRRGRDIDAADAYRHVFGYTCLLDLSARGKGDRSRRKSYDGFTPMGPWVVTADEIEDPQRLTITLSVNGEERQRGSTADMTYSIAELIAYASRVMTLEPGDVIATGTPEGVGAIADGDVVRLEIEHVGALWVNVVAPSPDAPIQDLWAPGQP